MDDFDFEEPADLDEVEGPIEPPGRRSLSLLLPLAALVLGLPLALYLIFRGGGDDATPMPSPPPLTAPPAPTPLATPAATPEPIDLPALDASDSAVRDLAAALSANPAIAAWFVPEDLLRKFVAIVENIAGGEDPAVHIKHLAPTEPFAAKGQSREMFVDPASYARFDAVGETAASIDAAEAVRIYRGAGPRLDEACAELGHPRGSFDRTLRRAVQKLLATPLRQGRLDLLRHSVAYEFADRRLEALEPAQKALVRMGANNQRRIQNKLREIQLALDGAPPAEVPPPSN